MPATDQMLRAHATVQARVARALVSMEACKAANEERRRNGYADAYSEAMIYAIIKDERIGENDVLEVLNAHD